MQMKTYNGPSMSAVLSRIKAELGPDAVILETVEKNGVISMTAALDPPATAAPSRRDAAASPQAVMPAEWEEMKAKVREWDSIKGHLLALMKPAMQLDALNPRQRLALEYLQGEGVSDEVIVSLYRELREDADSTVLEPLSRSVPIKPWGLADWPERFHLLCGPFGAGKTTSGLRMALALKKEHPELRIAFINADAARGNGRMLLRHYCELSDFACREAASSLEVGAAVKAMREEAYDRVFIDLSGLPKGKTMSGLPWGLGLDSSEAAAHLVMGPHYSADAAGRILERYRTDLPASLIWSRLDEVETYGSLVNIAVTAGLPTSAFSFGPGLGGSLVPARENLLWKLVFKRLLPLEGEA